MEQEGTRKKLNNRSKAGQRAKADVTSQKGGKKMDQKGEDEEMIQASAKRREGWAAKWW